MSSNYDNEAEGDLKKPFMHNGSWYRIYGMGSTQSGLLSSAIATREIGYYGNGVHHLAKCILPSSVVLQVVYGHIRSSTSNDIVFAKETSIELFILGEYGIVQSVCEQTVFGTIKEIAILPYNRKLHAKHSQMQGKDLLLVTSDSGKLSFLTFFNSMHSLQVGNIGGRDFAESLAPDVQKLLMSSSCRPLVRKKAALCLLRLYRKNPDVLNVDGCLTVCHNFWMNLCTLTTGLLLCSSKLGVQEIYDWMCSSVSRGSHLFINWWFIQFVDRFFSPMYEQLGIDIFGKCSWPLH